jgi:hypothetical protein
VPQDNFDHVHIGLSNFEVLGGAPEEGWPGGGAQVAGREALNHVPKYSRVGNEYYHLRVMMAYNNF